MDVPDAFFLVALDVKVRGELIDSPKESRPKKNRNQYDHKGRHIRDIRL